MKMAFRDTGWWNPLASQQHFFMKLSLPSSPSCLISVHLGNAKDRALPKKPRQQTLSHTSSNTPTFSQPACPNWTDITASVQTCTKLSDVICVLTLSRVAVTGFGGTQRVFTQQGVSNFPLSRKMLKYSSAN